MTAEEVLRSNEESALTNNQITYRGGDGKRGGFKIKKGFGVVIFITSIFMILVLFLFGGGNLIPAWWTARISEYINEQFSAGASSMKGQVLSLVLSNGSLGKDTIKRLKQNGVDVGYTSGGQFVEVSFMDEEKSDIMVTRNSIDANLTSIDSVDMNGITSSIGQPLSLKIGDKIVSAEELPSAMLSDARLFDAIDKATYGDAAYWYDETAEKILSRNGVSRNVFKNNGDFNTEMTKVVGKGSNINIEGMGEVEKEVLDDNGDPIKNEDGSTKTTTEVEGEGNVNSGSSSGLIAWLSEKVKAISEDLATVNAATILSTSETIVKENQSMNSGMGFLETINKMQSGYGGESQITEALTTLFAVEESEVPDVKNGTTKIIKGSALEAPSMYAALTGEKVNLDEVENYSDESILRTVENQGYNVSGSNSFLKTIASVGAKAKGLIGRLLGLNDTDTPNKDALQMVEPAIDNALINNSFEDKRGIALGQELVYGFTTLGAENGKGFGGTNGGEAEVAAYRKLTEQVLALRAEADRMNRSPLDVTSKNTFLGSILYKFAVSSMKSGTILNKLATISKVTASSVSALLPSVNADNELDDSYLSTFGNCSRIGGIGAVGTADCAQIITFDTSNFNQVTNMDSDYYRVVAKNVTCDENNICTIIKGSDFWNFAAYYVDRVTPDGVTDAGILDSITEDKNVSFVSSLINAAKKWLFADDEEKDIASGAAFVYSSDNKDWEEKYGPAQAYFLEVRIAKALASSDSSTTAYSNLPFIGSGNPVLACLEEIENERSVIASE